MNGDMAVIHGVHFINDVLDLDHGVLGGGDEDGLGAGIGNGVDGDLLFEAVAHAGSGRGSAGPASETAAEDGSATVPPALVLVGLEVRIREKGEEFGGDIGAIGIAESKEADLDGVFLGNIQLPNDVGDAGHKVGRGADEDGVVLVVGDGIDMNGGTLAFVGVSGGGAATTPTPADEGGERVATPLGGGLIGENILQFSGDGLGIGVSEQKDLEVAIAGAVNGFDDLGEAADVGLAAGHDDGIAGFVGVHFNAFWNEGVEVLDGLGGVEAVNGNNLCHHLGVLWNFLKRIGEDDDRSTGVVLGHFEGHDGQSILVLNGG